MKYLYLITVLLSSVLFSQNNDQINWISLEEAVENQKNTPKKIFMDVYTTWCGPCKMMDSNTFTNKKLIKYVNENYYAVKFNAENKQITTYKGNEYRKGEGKRSQHQFARYLKVSAYPSLVFFDEEAKPISVLPGYKDVKNAEVFLKLFVAEDYKNIKTKEEWIEYQKNMKFSFSK
ncbi:MAG: thioredoxin fold domain-containing protein [Flavobacteriaceae bacterium]|nr:thioredoxin fold domain-containing protein [Flavobacteriaceae bacterium]